MTTQTTPQPEPSDSPPPAPARSRAEITTRSVQVVLLCLGGLLLMAAVVVFTAVAWRQLGDGGRLTILAGFTGCLLAVPLALTRFRLWATAETLAAIATMTLWCSALAGYYLYLPAGTGLTASSVAAWTTGILITAVVYRIIARVSSPGWALLPLGAAGASFAAVADLSWAAIHMTVIGAVLAGAAWTIRALPTRHTRSDQWSSRVLMCAAIVTVFLAGLRVAFGLDASLLPVVAAAMCLIASAGLLATVQARHSGASKSTVIVMAAATASLIIAAWVVSYRSASPALALPAFALLAVAITAPGAETHRKESARLPLAAAALSGIAALGTLGVVLTDSYEVTSYFGAAVLALAVSPVFQSSLRTALRQAAAMAGAAVLTWCAAIALTTVPLAYGAAPVPLLRWEIPVIAIACAAGLPLVPNRWRPEFLASLTAVALLATGGLVERLWAPPVAFALIAAVALAVAFTSRSGAGRGAGWIGAYLAPAVAATSAAHLEVGGLQPEAYACFGVAAGAILFTAAITMPLDQGAGRSVARNSAHPFIGLNLLWLLLATGPAEDASEISALAPLSFTVYAAALAVAAWASPNRRVAYALGSSAAAIVAHLLLAIRSQAPDVEYYTVPPALLLLGIGLWLLRRDPSMGSWTALAPALLIGFAPTLALSFGPDGEPMRRIALGAAALAVVLIAVWRRWQAPLTLGSVVLAALSVNELVLMWSVVPKWIPLAVGGAVLITAGATLEQRRRDLARLSGNLKAMR